MTSNSFMNIINVVIAYMHPQFNIKVELKLLLALANQFFKFADVGIVEVITQFKDPVAELFVIFQSVDLLKSEDHNTKLVDGNVVIKTL